MKIRFNLKKWYRFVKWFIQRGRRGWADCDSWDIDYYLVKIIPPMLDRLKRGHDYPMMFKTEEEWYEKIDIMLAGFDAGQRLLDMSYEGDSLQIIEAVKKDRQIFNIGMNQFTKYFFDLWD